MQFRITCPQCGRRFNVTDKYAGRTAACKCTHRISFPQELWTKHRPSEEVDAYDFLGDSIYFTAEVDELPLLPDFIDFLLEQLPPQPRERSGAFRIRYSGPSHETAVRLATQCCSFARQAECSISNVTSVSIQFNTSPFGPNSPADALYITLFPNTGQYCWQFNVARSEDGNCEVETPPTDMFSFDWYERSLDVPALIATVASDENLSKRMEAIRTLDDLGEWIAVPVLSKVIRMDQDPSIREATAKALGSTCMLMAVDALCAALADDHPRVREASAKALEIVLSWRSGEREEQVAIQVLRAAASDDAQSSVREASARALGKIGSTPPVTALCSILGQDDDPAVREACAVALGEIGDLRAAAHLVEAAVTSGVSERCARESLMAIKNQNSSADLTHHFEKLNAAFPDQTDTPEDDGFWDAITNGLN